MRKAGKGVRVGFLHDNKAKTPTIRVLYMVFERNRDTCKITQSCR